MGLNEERYNAGKMPATSPTNNAVNIMNPSVSGLPITESCFKAISLTTGISNCAITIANKEEIKHVTSDSKRNCFTNELLNAPDTFLTPTSFVRNDDLAVERLI